MGEMLDADLSLAVCTQIDPDLYFPDNLSEAMSNNVSTVKELCLGCPLLVACFEHAMTFNYLEDHGVWGGTTAYERKQFKTRPARLRAYRMKIKEIASNANKAKGEAA